MIGWFGTALLCYVTSEGHLVCPTERLLRDGVIAYKNPPPRRRPRQRAIPPRVTATTRSGKALEFRWKTNSTSASTPTRGREFHGTPRCRRKLQLSHFCSIAARTLRHEAHRGPCASSPPSEGVSEQDAAQEGMETKAEEFVTKGAAGLLEGVS